jgi:RecA/RadA recombinase
MLTRRMQIQAIADVLAGLGETGLQVEAFDEPWRTIYAAVRASEPGHGRQVLLEVLADRTDREMIAGSILAMEPGKPLEFPSLLDIAAGLSPIEWLWCGWIPRGMLTVLGAAQGSGKSFVALDLAWRIIAGEGFPDGQPVPKPGANVVYVDAEAVPQILNERAAHYGVDRSKLFLMLPEHGVMLDFNTQECQEQLIERVAALQPELVIVDSLSSVHNKGQNNVEDVRGLLNFFTQVASYYRVGLILIHHIRKPGPGGQMLLFDISMEDLSGSGHITAMARSVLGLRVVKTGPEVDLNGPRELKVLKTNLGPYPDPLGFEFAPLHPKGVFLKWLDEAPRPYREPTKAEQCTEWLEATLRQAEEPVKPREIVDLAVSEGYGRRTVYRARRELGNKVRNTEGQNAPNNAWEWVG